MRAAAVIGVLLVLAAPGVADAAQPRASFTDVQDEVMCDTCNVPLNLAVSDRADQLRAQIRRLIAKGETKQQIKDELERVYGPEILASPPDSGFSLAVWIVPVVVVAGLLALAAALLPRWRRRARARPLASEGPELSPPDAQRLDDDLARYEL